MPAILTSGAGEIVPHDERAEAVAPAAPLEAAVNIAAAAHGQPVLLRRVRAIAGELVDRVLGAVIFVGTDSYGTVFKEYSTTKHYAPISDPKIEVRVGADLPQTVTL